MPESQAPAPDDALLLQESDAPESPPVLLIDLSSIAHPIWHVSQQEPDPDHTSASARRRSCGTWRRIIRTRQSAATQSHHSAKS